MIEKVNNPTKITYNKLSFNKNNLRKKHKNNNN